MIVLESPVTVMATALMRLMATDVNAIRATQDMTVEPVSLKFTTLNREFPTSRGLELHILDFISGYYYFKIDRKIVLISWMDIEKEQNQFQCYM